jgi:S-adenosylmethionine:tRNA ribosyltransferase-isomerase
LNRTDFYYELPENLIAQHPIKNRDESRLLIVNRKTGNYEHMHFSDIKNYLNRGDCLVLNDTRVIPARLFGEKENTGGKIEFVLLKKIKNDIWEVILKPGKKAKPGAWFTFSDGLLRAEILEIIDGGNRLVRFHYEGIFEEILDKAGIMPLPPYIREKLQDKERYQTVYSKIKGSAAAPTAGLHFTDSLLNEIKKSGVEIVFVTLHVGLGTFRPVKEKKIENHKMHSEYYSITKEAADKVNSIKEKGGNIIAVGTTSCRVLESSVDKNGNFEAKSGETDIFIYPGYKFKIVDRLITNFHLPESTLLMLVSALTGRELILSAYKEAINKKYRFFSFGDAMMIV